MLLLIAGLILGLWLYNRAPRLEGAGEAEPAVSAFVDGKQADAYVKEASSCEG